MATQNRNLWSGYDPVSGLTATIALTWDDVNLRIDSFTITNPTSKMVSISATSTSTGKNYSGTVPPETNATINMTPGTQNRLDITVTANGRLDGVEYNINFG